MLRYKAIQAIEEFDAAAFRLYRRAGPAVMNYEVDFIASARKYHSRYNIFVIVTMTKIPLTRNPSPYVVDFLHFISICSSSKWLFETSVIALMTKFVLLQGALNWLSASCRDDDLYDVRDYERRDCRCKGRFGRYACNSDVLNPSSKVCDQGKNETCCNRTGKQHLFACGALANRCEKGSRCRNRNEIANQKATCRPHQNAYSAAKSRKHRNTDGPKHNISKDCRNRPRCGKHANHERDCKHLQSERDRPERNNDPCADGNKSNGKSDKSRRSRTLRCQTSLLLRISHWVIITKRLRTSDHTDVPLGVTLWHIHSMNHPGFAII